ncbi:MAG: phosphatase PAP2 family protein [Spirochaetales bacterium]|nr:phosphatase PAP2 family protein [Spirochaetales bacterium]
MKYREAEMKKILALCVITLLLAPGLSAFRFEYSEDLDRIGDAGMYLSLALPGTLLLEAEKEAYPSLVLSYGATLGAGYLVRTVLKEAITAQRPYVGHPDAPPPSGDDYRSFPSGHALLSFASAAYLQTAVCLRHPDSTLLRSMAVANWILAAATSTLRVVGGSHHVRDVLAGAAIGGGLGFLGPFITDRLQQRDGDAPRVLIGQAVGVHLSY